MLVELLKDAKVVIGRMLMFYWKALVDVGRVMLHVWVWTYVIWQFLWMLRKGEQIFGNPTYAIWEVDVRYHPTIFLVYLALTFMIAYPLGMIRQMIADFKSRQ